MQIYLCKIDQQQRLWNFPKQINVNSGLRTNIDWQFHSRTSSETLPVIPDWNRSHTHTIQMSVPTACNWSVLCHRTYLPRACPGHNYGILLELKKLRFVGVFLSWWEGGPRLFSIALVQSTVHLVCVLLRVSSDDIVMCECNVILSCVSSHGPAEPSHWPTTIHIWAESRSWHASYDKLLLAVSVQIHN